MVNDHGIDAEFLTITLQLTPTINAYELISGQNNIHKSDILERIVLRCRDQ